MSAGSPLSAAAFITPEARPGHLRVLDLSLLGSLRLGHQLKKTALLSGVPGVYPCQERKARSRALQNPRTETDRRQENPIQGLAVAGFCPEPWSRAALGYGCRRGGPSSQT